jgi:putative MATE family efflux protein
MKDTFMAESAVSASLAVPVPETKPAVSAAAAQRAARTQRLLHAPIAPTLLALAAPNIVTMVAQTAVSIAEASYIGHLGTASLAGLALVFPIVMLMQMMSAGAMGGAISSAMARSLGAGNTARAEALILHVLAIAASMAALYTLVMLSFGGTIFALLGGRGDALSAALDYSKVLFAGALAIWLCNSFASILRGTGNMAVPSLVLVGTACIQVPLGGALVLGWGPFPAMGMSGAALATVASFSLGAAAMIVYVASGAAGIRLRLAGVQFQRELFWDILRVGLIACLSALQTAVTIILVTSLVGAFGLAAIAGYGLGARLEFLLIPIVFGIGAALTAMVGANVGAGQWQRARRIAWTGAGIAALVTGCIGLFFGLFPSAWVGLYSDDPGVTVAGGAYLAVVAPCYAFFGLGMALYFASQGAGRMILPFFAGFIRLLVAVGGGAVVVFWMGAGLSSLFAAIALGMALFGILTAASVNPAIWRPGR